ncbi:MAG: hypothetical protein HJJLKODD_01154 [Phycisphaerae bacterium]|nr:hypothetical protein [Phycisphaerae bacterium]
MSLTRSTRASGGFTLIELLVVTAIISTLISILLPSVASVRRLAQGLVCASNQRQLAMAVNYYARSNDDWLNPLEDYVYPGGVQSEITFRVLLYDYAGRVPKLFDCPAESRAVYADGLTALDAAYGGFALDGSYEWSKLFGVVHPRERWNASGIGIAGVHWIRNSDPHPELRVKSMPFGRQLDSGYFDGMTRMDEIRMPYNLVWFGDGGSGTADLWASDNWWIKYVRIPNDYGQGEPGFNRILQDDYGCWRHESSANYVMADGHYEKLNANDIRCDQQLCRWSIDPYLHQSDSIIYP